MQLGEHDAGVQVPSQGAFRGLGNGALIDSLSGGPLRSRSRPVPATVQATPGGWGGLGS